MASSIFYRFKSRKDEFRITFDGTGISVFDVKKEIILANNLAKAFDFDLHIYDQQEEEYKDDSHIIPRSTPVIVKRRPAAKHGRGSATKYIIENNMGPEAGANNVTLPAWQRTAMSKRFDGKDDAPVVQVAKPTTLDTDNIAQGEEAAAIAAMFQAQDAHWGETQEKMSHATYVHRGGPRGGRPRGGGPNHQEAAQHRISERPLPASYVCYRCGQKGHWIQDCPTNNDREFDNRPRMKRTTGIPRSFLQTVENPGTNTQGLMVTPEGGFVVAKPDAASWQKQLSKRTKALTEAEVRERVPSNPQLVCPIDKKLFRDAVRTPCCSTTYCEECIQSHLLEHDFLCPNCERKVPGLDKLSRNDEIRDAVARYIEGVIEDSKNGDDIVDAPVEQQDMAELSASAGPVEVQNDAADPDNMPQIIADSVPQLQAQVQQLASMLQNPSLPANVRRQTEVRHQELQMQLQGAQTIAMALAASQAQGTAAGAGGLPGLEEAWHNVMAGPNFMGAPGWNPQFDGQGSINEQDSAYQRLPVNNRRRNLKRERPSDFLEIGSVDGDQKQPRYWE